MLGRRQIRIHNYNKIVSIICQNENRKSYQILKWDKKLKEVSKLTSFLDKYYIKISWGQRFWHIKNNNYIIFKCRICDDHPARYDKNREYITCSQRCQNISANINKKITSKKLFGVDNFSKTKEFIIKTEKTNLDRYGVNNYAKTKESKIKSKKTCLLKYKSEFYQQTAEFTDRVRSKWFKKFHKENYQLLEIQSKKYKLIHKICKTIFEIKKPTFCARVKNDVDICISCNPLRLGTPSKGEIELSKFVNKIYDGEISRNNRDIISPLELDIYLPDINLAIEYNGYYHTKPKVIERDKRKKMYCKEKNIFLLVVWEENWKKDRKFIENLILNILRKDLKLLFKYINKINNHGRKIRKISSSRKS